MKSYDQQAHDAASAPGPDQLVVEISTAINPLEVARWLQSKHQFSRGTFADYIKKAIIMHWLKRKPELEAVAFDWPHFSQAMWKRIKYVLEKAGEMDGLGELKEFAQHMTKSPKIIIPMGALRNGGEK